MCRGSGLVTSEAVGAVRGRPGSPSGPDPFSELILKRTPRSDWNSEFLKFGILNFEFSKHTVEIFFFKHPPSQLEETAGF